MLTIEDIIKIKQPKENLSVIYFLIKDNTIVYVGQSITGTNRIVNHKKDKDFDSYSFIPIPKELLNETEQSYIRTFMPSYNKDDNPIHRFKKKNLI
jgi:hypothetical protein